MPGVSIHSATKNLSKSGRSKDAKNKRRVEAAINDELEGCTYGRITKILGNKMFKVIIDDKTEHLAYIRGKMVRIGINDIVLLNIREYETRGSTRDAVYDIMASFSTREATKLVKNKTIPDWMLVVGAVEGDGVELSDLFDYEKDSDEEDEEGEENPAKKNKKSHRTKAVIQSDDDAVDIGKI
jgi:translation initiation factor IF-1